MRALETLVIKAMVLVIKIYIKYICENVSIKLFYEVRKVE